MKFSRQPNKDQSIYLKKHTQQNVICSLQYVLDVCEEILDPKVKQCVVEFIDEAAMSHTLVDFYFI
ncbi:hypothetical protein [Xenorhabdus kozodoii]|uniref:Transposase n=1 Tax=Xenorhabdus kozodoii TaxID=351676 RepID=A0A2D0LEX9_9GAMM|nr:hypothetical protein [Xenorhabdus kozodoii]PHM74248.1 hypothetical protein Xkoz_01134 [Xenorhabdus kozodoii]